VDLNKPADSADLKASAADVAASADLKVLADRDAATP
jgi:hypothetical protein